MSRASLLSIAIVSALAVLPTPGAAASPDKWNEEQGPGAARGAAEACLARSDADGRNGCIRAPYERCVAEHGHQTTIDLGQCIRWSTAAWKSKLDQAVARIERRAPADLVVQFKASEASWSNWLPADCRLQAEWARGGTEHALELGWCELDQVGSRAIAIGVMADAWDR